LLPGTAGIVQPEPVFPDAGQLQNELLAQRAVFRYYLYIVRKGIFHVAEIIQGLNRQ
jgi:glyoxylate utilization-related uncharacterized protein